MKTHSRRAAECREGADSGRSRDRDQTAQFIGLRMSLKAIDLYAQAHDDRPALRCGLLVTWSRMTATPVSFGPKCPVIHPA